MERRVWEAVLLINLIGIALFAAVASGPSYHRLCMIAPPAIIASVWLFSGARSIDRMMRGLLWSIAIMLFLFLSVHQQFVPRGYLDLPTGRTAFIDPNVYEMNRWLAQHTQAGDQFFSLTQVSFPLALENPTQVDFITATGMTPPEQVEAVVQSLEKRPAKYIFLSRFRAPPGTEDNLQEFRLFVLAHYHLAKAFPAGDFWELN